MSGRRKMRRAGRSCLRRLWSWWRDHWRGVGQILLRGVAAGGVVCVAYLLWCWVGPPEVGQFSGDEAGDLRESRRVAFHELARYLKLGIIVLGAVAMVVLLAVYWSRSPVSWVRQRKYGEAEREAKQERSGSSSAAGDEPGSHTIFIDPDTAEDYTADSDS